MSSLEKHTCGGEQWLIAEGELPVHVYLDPIIGLDSNDGLSERAAIQSLSRLSDLLQKFQLPYVIHLRRNGVPV